MKRNGCFFVVVGAVLLSIFPLKADDNSSEAKALLYEAKAITSRANFRAVTPVYTDGKLQKNINLYRMIAPDGTLLEKVENIWPDLLPEAYISNKSGTYVFIANDVAKTDAPLYNRNVIYMSINEFYDKGAIYSVADDVYKNIPCYKVTVKLPTEQSFIDELILKFRNSSKDPRKYITTSFPFVKDYLVGKDNHFIYCCSFYNLEGEKTLSRDWGNVDFKTPVDERIFKTPQDDILQLNKNSEKFRYICSLFDISSIALDKADVFVKESDRARDILFSAMDTTENASFKAICKVTKGGKEYKTVNTFHIVMPDGTVQERIEYTWWNSWKETYIPKNSEAYVMLGSTLIKTSYGMGSRQFIYKNVKSDIAEATSYSIADGDYKGMPCYKITVKNSTDPAYIKERIKRVQKEGRKSEEELMAVLPFAKTFLVGKRNNFIYACTFYNILGKRISTEEWGTVTFNPPMNAALFAPPKGIHVLSAKTPKKFMQIKERCIALFKAAKR